MPIPSDFENIPIRNITFPLFSCAGCDMIFQKNVGLKTRQRYYEGWTGKPADDIE